MHGLRSEDAIARLKQYGPNEIQREAPVSRWRLFLMQFNTPLVWLLLVACALSIALKEVVDGMAIGVIVLLNGVVGFFQEYRAERAVHALRALTAPRARVLRDGHALQILAKDIVVGDVILIEEGDRVAADAQIGVSHGLSANEAILTGESQPVEKELHSKIFAGTAITSGSGRATVQAIGMQTELGKIAHLLATTQKQRTPLQIQLETVSHTLMKLCLGVVGLVAVLGLWRGEPWLDVLMASVSLAVAAVPEGLPAVVTIALALGVERMAAHHVLVRKLASVETLGSASVICTDKTGTLTTGIMTVRRIWAEIQGQYRQSDDVTASPELLHALAACNDADIEGHSGDPTELALLLAAQLIGFNRLTIEQENPRQAVIAFDARRKRMSILRANGVLYVKGAPDILIPLCISGTEGAHEAAAQMAREGLRVLGMAIAKDRLGQPISETDLQLIGLVGLADPPRPEAIKAVAQAHTAGITVMMLTGDHPITALAIAREIGIVGPQETAEDKVFARVTPEDKLRIVRHWKEKGAIVAMTGDGVNDAPALKEAHIGVAMGLGGTEVTREAADMILSDDNFASMIAGIREGRAIFDNIQKALVYLLTGNTGELLLMLGASLIGLPIPLLPLHLLWINLVTDGLPALTLVVDPPDPDVLTRPPRPMQQPMLGKQEWTYIIAGGLMDACLVLGVFGWSLDAGVDRARSLAFGTLVFCEIFRTFSARSRHLVFWEVGAFSNLKLLAVVIISGVMQVALYQFSFTQQLFRLSPLSFKEIGLTLALGLLPVTVTELFKLTTRLWKNITPS